MKDQVLAFVKYGIFLAVVLFLYMFNFHPVTLMLLYGAVFFPIAEVIAHRLLGRMIEVSVAFPEVLCDRNRTVHMLLNIKNKSWYPQIRVVVRYKIADIFSANDYVHEYAFMVGAYKTEEYQVPMHFAYCGIFQAEVCSVTSWDLLHFSKMEILPESYSEIVVMPMKIELNNALKELRGSLDEEEWIELAQKGTDPSEIFELRTYQQGDRLNTIHWKLSAKESELIVKEFGDVTGELYRMYVDLSYKDNRQKDSFFDLLYSVCSELCRNHIYFSVCWRSNNKDTVQTYLINKSEDILSVLISLFYVEPVTENLMPTMMTDIQRQNVLILTTKSYKKDSRFRLVANNNNLARLYEYNDQ